MNLEIHDNHAGKGVSPSAASDIILSNTAQVHRPGMMLHPGPFNPVRIPPLRPVSGLAASA